MAGPSSVTGRRLSPNPGTHPRSSPGAPRTSRAPVGLYCPGRCLETVPKPVPGQVPEPLVPRLSLEPGLGTSSGSDWGGGGSTPFKEQVSADQFPSPDPPQPYGHAPSPLWDSDPNSAFHMPSKCGPSHSGDPLFSEARPPPLPSAGASRSVSERLQPAPTDDLLSPAVTSPPRSREATISRGSSRSSDWRGAARTRPGG